jgi:hypothetical protein
VRTFAASNERAGGDNIARLVKRLITERTNETQSDTIICIRAGYNPEYDVNFYDQYGDQKREPCYVVGVSDPGS